MWRMSPPTQQRFEKELVHTLLCKRWYLTKNPDVKILELLGYTRVELWTLREVNWNDTNFTTVLFFWGMEGSEGEEWGEECVK